MALFTIDRNIILQWSGNFPLHRILACHAHHPRNTKLVHAHAEQGAPECGHWRHGHLAAFCQFVEHAIGLVFSVGGHGERNIVSSRNAGLTVHGVAAHEVIAAAHGKGNVHDQFGIGRRMIAGRCIFETDERLELATKCCLVMIEGCFAVAIEAEIGI
jgi:hypothetical protein